MRTIAAVILSCCAALAQDKTDKLYLEGPKDAKEEDLKKAAEAVEKRCRAWGWQGLTARVDGGRIELSYKPGFENTSTERIRMSSFLTARKIEIKIEQWVKANPGGEPKPKSIEEIKKRKSPKGTHWYSTVAYALDAFDAFKKAEFSDYTWGNGHKAVLLRDEPVFGSDVLSKIHKPDVLEGGRYFYEIDAEALKKIAKALDPKESFPTIWVVADDNVWFWLNKFEKPGEKPDPKSKPKFAGESLEICDVILQNPLPFALKVVK